MYLGTNNALLAGYTDSHPLWWPIPYLDDTGWEMGVARVASAGRDMKTDPAKRSFVKCNLRHQVLKEICKGKFQI